MESIISIKNLSKSFEDKLVLSNLNIDIKKSSVTFIMGANGQGKTTFLNSMLSLIPFEKGEIYLNNKLVNGKLTLEEKRQICYISDNPPFIEYLDCIDNLKYIAHIYKKKISMEEMEKVLCGYGLKPDNKTAVKDYSKGMRTKLALCVIDIIDSELIILDEPTVGLDIVYSDYLQKKILELKSKGKTILVTSHDTTFVSCIADEIYLLNNKGISLLLNSDQKEIIRDTRQLSKILIDNIKLIV